MITEAGAVRAILGDIALFSASVWPTKALRRYQLPAARAMVASALRCDGETHALCFARQSGKDELLAQVFAFLLIRLQRTGGEIVVAEPSLTPQGEISMRRLVDRLAGADAFHPGIERDGHIVRVGQASVRYLSAGPDANARGATASVLLVANEAQDIGVDHWDAVFEPMGASTNSPTVFSGTVWTNDTLLARGMQVADRTGRLYRVDWEAVAAEVPAYGARVRARIAELGAEHPFVRTEYRLLPLEGGGLLFDAGRLAQMRGDHQRAHSAIPGRTYALLIDVAGEEEEQREAAHVGASDAKSRDATVLTVVEVERPAASASGMPVYRVVDRRIWQGANHVQLAAEIGDLARRVWRAARVVVDATGIGHGLAAMLTASLGPAVVLPFVFTSVSKSDLGWRFLAAIGAGRYQEYGDDGAEDTRRFWQQAAACAYAVRPGPGRLMQWSVPERAGHDDVLLSAALVGALDDLDWRPRVAMGRS